MKLSSFRRIVSVVFFSCIGALPSSAQITKEDITSRINIHDLRHPYLFFSNEEKPEIRKRIQSDPESRNIMKRLVAEGNRFLRRPFQKKVLYQPAHPRFETENDALPYLTDISDGAVTLAFLYQMTGDEKYTQRAIEYAEAICDVPEWKNAAHAFDIIYPRVWPWNVPNDQVVFSYDIYAARIARTLSTAYDWLYPAMTMQQRDKIRNGLLEKAVTRVRGNYEFFWWSSAYKCNWSVICYSGLGVSALALLTESPQLADVVAESYNRIGLTYDQIGEEGGWQEGRGYSEYMLTSGAYFMDALKRVSHNKLDLFRHPKIKATAFDFQLYALTASFGDSDGKSGTPTYAANKFVAETGSATSAFYREKFLGAGSDMFDILWPRSTVRPEEPKQKSRLFKNINWAVLRSDFFDPSTVTVACKAGFNDDPHHGHLDCGQFTVTWQNVPFIRDLGRMKYDEQYFNEERFEYLLASSEGHNVVSVNGEQQIVAKKKDAEWKSNVGGNILEYRTDDTRDYVLMDPTHAYPGKELKHWRRNIVLEKPAVTLVVDEVGADIGATIAARFFPGTGDNGGVDTRPEPGRHKASVKAPHATGEEDFNGGKILKDHVLLTDRAGHSMVLIPLVLDNEFRIVGDKAAALPVANDAALEWVQYVETVATAKAPTTIIATLILPVADEKDAQRMSASAKIAVVGNDKVLVSMNDADRSLQWVFEKTADGLVLQK
jgi:Heparinase II/III-like protein